MERLRSGNMVFLDMPRSVPTQDRLMYLYLKPRIDYPDPAMDGYVWQGAASTQPCRACTSSAVDRRHFQHTHCFGKCAHCGVAGQWARPAQRHAGAALELTRSTLMCCCSNWCAGASGSARRRSRRCQLSPWCLSTTAVSKDMH